ncbi:MAG: hypothetical protein IPF63_05915 [Bacteroidetes bacterium]|nr:hypothetical protein [Bacteroidota bacterium]
MDQAILGNIKNLIGKEKGNEKPIELLKKLLRIQFITQKYIIDKKQLLQNILIELHLLDKTPQLEASQLIEKKRSYQKWKPKEWN